jgi:von Willebrand factor type A domain
MSQEPLKFSLRVDHNENLAIGEQQLHAIVQVSALEPDTEAATEVPVAAEVIIIDTSKSMTGSRIEAALRAACAAVDTVRDGSYFAVVAGHTRAELVYPPHPPMVKASARNRDAAKQMIATVVAAGETYMSTWLSLADKLLAGCREARIKHAIMLTDGRSMDDQGELADALKACQGRFVCDCRGIGHHWRDDQLRQIAHALLGTWAPVAAPGDLTDDFRAALTASMAKRVPDVALRVRLYGQARVRSLAQVMPCHVELTGKGVATDDGRAVEFSLGHWGPQQVRDYHLRLDTRQDALRIENGGRARTARLEVVLPGSGKAAVTAPVGVSWTDDLLLTTSINQRVAGYTGQEELAAAVAAGLDAWRHGRRDAEEKLGRAVRLAREVGNTLLLERFTAIAEFVDPAAGVIRLPDYRQVSQADVLWASYLSEQSRYIEPDGGDG